MTQEPIAYINVEKRTLEFAKNIFWHTPTVVNLDRIPLYTKEALAQTQEPVAWMYQEYRDDDQFGWRDEILFTPPPNDPIYFRNITPVYTHPPQRTEQEPVKIVQYNCKCGRTMKFESVHGVVAPQRTWVGLTRDEQSFVYSNLHNATSRKDSFWVDFANAIEAKLKEKNT
jgi:hypothetical protein